MKRVAVIAGAGPAGLTAAFELLRRSDVRPLVFETGSQVGGISRTVNYRGNRMDLGGHRFFSKSDWVMQLVAVDTAGGRMRQDTCRARPTRGNSGISRPPRRLPAAHPR